MSSTLLPFQSKELKELLKEDKKSKLYALISYTGIPLLLVGIVLAIFTGRQHKLILVLCMLMLLLSLLLILVGHWKLDCSIDSWDSSLLTLYKSLVPYYKNNSIPESIKLLFNLDYTLYYSGKEEPFEESYKDLLIDAKCQFSFIADNPDCLPFIYTSISKIGDIDQVIPRALNISRDPAILAYPDTYASITHTLDEMCAALEKGINEYKVYNEKISKAYAVQQVNALSKQDFGSVTDFKEVQHHKYPVS